MPIRIDSVLFVPELDRRLLSVPVLVERGLNLSLENGTCEIRNNHGIVTEVARMGEELLLIWASYTCLAQPVEWRAFQAKMCMPLKKIRMSNMRFLEQCVNGFKTTWPSSIDNDEDEICDGCLNGKLSVKPFPKSNYGKVKTKSVLEIIHSDVLGPTEIKSQGGARFMVTFIDDFSRYVVVYFITQKYEIVDQFMKYKAMMENQFNAKIKCIRTDNGVEYVNRRFSKMCQSSGIIHQTAVPYSPQQNGLAEWMNWTLMERTRSMINYMQVDKKWGRLDTFDTFDTFENSSVFSIAQDGHNIPRMLSGNQESQALVPVGSNSIVSANDKDIIRRLPKRYQIESEHANSALTIPSSFQEALKSPESQFWKEAITSELKALKKKNTWTAIKNKGKQKGIGMEWVFAIKRNENGDVERYKARLVALGYRSTNLWCRLVGNILSSGKFEFYPCFLGNMLSSRILNTPV
uniref:Putative polyprotein n=1 Tax=Albugo laibachii Nc14 TaxID=890382 RepID=F0X2D1_9STRA|nr:putative polyprotein [Albugo laibachii Nc14]|eukprot:CCA28017.1 putative polyprotein [Albugo laibachii Nc14]